jgi:hypothetical protein
MIVTDYSHWVKIIVYVKNPASEVIESLFWNNLSFGCRTKWDWYFDYRYALLRIKYPKAYIEKRWGHTEITNESSDELIYRKNVARRTTLRRKVTQFKNAIYKYEEEEKMKLIPDLTNPRYLRTVEKLKEYETELIKNECNMNPKRRS